MITAFEGETAANYISEELCNRIGLIPKGIIESDALKSFGAELLRNAMNQFFKSYAEARMIPPNEIGGESYLSAWLLLIEENLCHSNENIRQGAAKALLAITSNYVTEVDKENSLMEKYRSQLLNTRLETQRVGMALALSHLPVNLLERNCVEIIKSLILCCRIVPRSHDKLWAEARCECLAALSKIANTVQLSDADSLEILKCFSNALEDYSVDQRGDIGHFVREAAMKCLPRFLQKYGANNDFSK